jgi:hypothetical protein
VAIPPGVHEEGGDARKDILSLSSDVSPTDVTFRSSSSVTSLEAQIPTAAARSRGTRASCTRPWLDARGNGRSRRLSRARSRLLICPHHLHEPLILPAFPTAEVDGPLQLPGGGRAIGSVRPCRVRAVERRQLLLTFNGSLGR